MINLKIKNLPSIKLRNALFVAFLLSISFHSFGQVHVASPNNIKMGKESIISAGPGVAEVVDIFGSLYVSQEPMTGPFSGGVYFTTRYNTNGIPSGANLAT
jgi:hypothetical protein